MRTKEYKRFLSNVVIELTFAKPTNKTKSKRKAIISFIGVFFSCKTTSIPKPARTDKEKQIRNKRLEGELEERKGILKLYKISDKGLLTVRIKNKTKRITKNLTN